MKSYTGDHFGNTSIRHILRQERYTGNTLFQKTYIDSGKTKYNNGELPQYYAKNTHPAIIIEETFNKVQEIMHKKRKLGAFANPHIKTNTLTSKIKCNIVTGASKRLPGNSSTTVAAIGYVQQGKRVKAIPAEQKTYTRNN